MMPDRGKVIKELRDIDMFIAGRFGHEKAKNFLRTIDEAIVLLKEQEKQKLFVDKNGEITPLPVVVRCKDCKHGEKVNSVYLCGKIRGFGTAHEPGWFCADGERREQE